MTADLTNAIFHDEDKAREHLEKIRWPNGPWCPHCGNAYPEKITKLQGESHRKGLHQCNECREHFTVTVGSVMESSHIPLHKWVLGFHLMASSKKGVSAHQLWRTLGLGSYRTAWFLAHRIRECMKNEVAKSGPIGGEGKTVEIDETYHGKLETPRINPQRKGRPFTKKGKGIGQKRVIIGLVERGGKVRTFHIHRATIAEVRNVVTRNVSRKSDLRTDESSLYTAMGKEFATHETVNHSAHEYVRGDVHTNTVESVWSVFKRGMHGVYHHCGEAHLHRYLAEFEFRHNHRSALKITDTERAQAIVEGAAGKRLQYRQASEAQNTSPVG